VNVFSSTKEKAPHGALIRRSTNCVGKKTAPKVFRAVGPKDFIAVPMLVVPTQVARFLFYLFFFFFY